MMLSQINSSFIKDNREFLFSFYLKFNILREQFINVRVGYFKQIQKIQELNSILGQFFAELELYEKSNAQKFKEFVMYGHKD